MPNWKKVITSGSDAALNSLLVSNAFTASGLQYPDADGISNQFLKTNGDGTLEFDYLINTSIAVKNVSGGTIFKGTPCYVTASGVSGNVAGIIPADAGDTNLMPAGIIAGEDLTAGTEGLGLLDGFINGVNTSDFNAGDTVYVAVGGGYTNVRPTGSGVLIQKLGNVEKVDASNGSGVINGPAYYNELPNWEEGKIVVGTSTYPVTSSFITLEESISQLTVEGNISASGEITTNTISTASLTIGSDSATNVDTFNTSSYNGAIYDYILSDTGVGARAGQFMVAHDSGLVTYTDTSTKHLSDSVIPEISAQVNGANIEVQVTNGNGYTFKSFVKKL